MGNASGMIMIVGLLGICMSMFLSIGAAYALGWFDTLLGSTAKPGAESGMPDTLAPAAVDGNAEGNTDTRDGCNYPWFAGGPALGNYMYTCPSNKDPYYITAADGNRYVVCCDQWDHNKNPSGNGKVEDRHYGNCSLHVDAFTWDTVAKKWAYCHTGNKAQGKKNDNASAHANCPAVPLFDNKTCLQNFRCTSEKQTDTSATANDKWVGAYTWDGTTKYAFRNKCRWMGNMGNAASGWDDHWELPSTDMNADDMTKAQAAAGGVAVATTQRGKRGAFPPKQTKHAPVPKSIRRARPKTVAAKRR